MEQTVRKAIALRNVLMGKEIGAGGNTMGVYLVIDDIKFPIRLTNIEYKGNSYAAPDINVNAEVLYENAPISLFDILQAKARSVVYDVRSGSQPWPKANPNITRNPDTYDPIEKVIFNDPATIVIWKDGSKTVVKVQEGDTYDPEKGLAMAIAKKFFGNKGNYCDKLKKWTDKYHEEHEESQFDIFINTLAEEAANNLQEQARLTRALRF
jgi:hypothetical protein